MFDEHVELLERAGIEQEFQALARRELALLVLGIDAGLATAELGGGATFFEFEEDVFHGEGSGCAGKWGVIGKAEGQADQLFSLAPLGERAGVRG